MGLAEMGMGTPVDDEEQQQLQQVLEEHLRPRISESAPVEGGGLR